VNEVLIALRPLIATFERLGVAYRVGGSLASSVHGIGRATMDANLIANLKPQDVSEFVESLQGTCYADQELILEALNADQSFNLIHLESFIKVDIFPLVSRAYDQTSFDRVICVDETNFITPEDSVLRKLEWYRLSDGSERQWRDVIGVLRVQADRLDLAYLRRWATELQELDLLERALLEAGKDAS
jgi:hypothetical protein